MRLVVDILHWREPKCRLSKSSGRILWFREQGRWRSWELSEKTRDDANERELGTLE